MTKLFAGKKLASAILASVCAATLLAGCGGEKKQAADTAAPAGQKGIRVSLYSYPTDLEPTNGYYGWGAVRMGISETLVKFDPSLKCVPWLATGWEQKGADTWVFHIRKGVKFHNGHEMTAQSVMDSLERSITKNKRAKNIANIKSMSVNGMDLTIVTNGPYAALLPYLAEPVFAIVDTTADTDFAMKPICTGPYMVESFQKSVNTHVVRFNDYWGKKAGLDYVDYPFLQDADARAMAMEAGDINVGQAIVNKDMKPFEDKSKFVIMKRPSTKTIFSFMNHQGPLGDKVLRQAISFAIDRGLYAKNFIGGEIATGPYSSTMGWGNENLKVDTFDPEKARKILDDAGYKDTDGDGYREKDGKNIELSLLVAGTSDITIFKPMSEAMQAQCKNVGLKVNINQVESYTEADAVKSNYLDLMYKHVNAGCTNDPQNYLTLYFETGGSNNFGNYSNPEFDALCEQLKMETDRDKRIALSEKMSQLLIDDVAGLFLGYPDYNVVTDKKVKNLTHYAVDWYCIDENVTTE